MYRHGDVLLAAVDKLPPDCVRRPSAILEHGEATGHHHRLADPRSGTLWESYNQLFVEVYAAGATIVHEEHQPITLPTGLYRVWKQREYTPRAIVTVRD